MNKELEFYEQRIIETILDCIEEKMANEKLYKQYRNMEVTKRTISKSGFFTEFYVKEQNLKLQNDEHLELGGIYAKVSGLNYGAGFVLYIRNGLIKMLEGYCFEEVWPNKVDIIQIFKVKQDGALEEI